MCATLTESPGRKDGCLSVYLYGVSGKKEKKCYKKPTRQVISVTVICVAYTNCYMVALGWGGGALGVGRTWEEI